MLKLNKETLIESERGKIFIPTQGDKPDAGCVGSSLGEEVISRTHGFSTLPLPGWDSGQGASRFTLEADTLVHCPDPPPGPRYRSPTARSSACW